MRRWRDRRLHQHLFAWLALTIVATIAISALVLSVFDMRGGSFGTHMANVGEFASRRFAEQWADAGARDALAREVAAAFGLELTLRDTDGELLSSTGGAACRGLRHVLEVRGQDGARLGQLEVCRSGLRHFHPGSGLAVLGTVCLVLWTAAALLARRITRPLSLLIAATRDIGRGHFGARVRLGRYARGELGSLAESINEMAGRIERQLEDQRELLAAVSHEVRSPLARLRLSAEILRTDPSNVAALDAIELEVVELDGLVGNLLASSRLDFETLSLEAVHLGELFRQVLRRHQLPDAQLEDESAGAVVEVDATLIARALDNLLDNAVRHAGGVAGCALRVSSAAPGTLVFEVRDAGPGFAAGALPRVFEAFYRASPQAPAASGSLGLGLALVRRIARAHGGDAWAENLDGGGARVAFSVLSRARRRTPQRRDGASSGAQVLDQDLRAQADEHQAPDDVEPLAEQRAEAAPGE